MHEIKLEPNQKIIIFGDIHGQFPDFIKVIEKEGPPSEKLKYVRGVMFSSFKLFYRYLMEILSIEERIQLNV